MENLTKIYEDIEEVDMPIDAMREEVGKKKLAETINTINLVEGPMSALRPVDLRDKLIPDEAPIFGKHKDLYKNRAIPYGYRYQPEYLKKIRMEEIDKPQEDDEYIDEELPPEENEDLKEYIREEDIEELNEAKNHENIVQHEKTEIEDVEQEVEEEKELEMEHEDEPIEDEIPDEDTILEDQPEDNEMEVRRDNELIEIEDIGSDQEEDYKPSLVNYEPIKEKEIEEEVEEVERHDNVDDI